MKKFKRLLIFYTLSILSVYMISEISLRIFCAQKLKKRHFAAVYMPDSVSGYKYKPNTYDTVVNPAYTTYMWGNEHGFFDEFDIDLEQNKDYFRIVFVGASDDIGPYSYVGLIREKFRKLNCKVQIINASVDGAYREVERLKYIIEDILALEPDLIFFTGVVPLFSNLVYRSHYKDFLLVYDDLNELSTIEDYVENTHYRFSWFKSFFDYSYSFRIVCKYYCENDNKMANIIGRLPMLRNSDRACEYLEQTVRVNEFKNLRRLSLDESYSVLHNMALMLKEKNISLVFSEKTSPNQEMKEFILSTGNKYIGSDPETNQDLTFGEADGHTTLEGHKIIVENYFQNLISSGLIPVQYLNDNLKHIAKLKE